jgi:hypothetical protein
MTDRPHPYAGYEYPPDKGIEGMFPESHYRYVISGTVLTKAHLASLSWQIQEYIVCFAMWAKLRKVPLYEVLPQPKVGVVGLHLMNEEVALLKGDPFAMGLDSIYRSNAWKREKIAEFEMAKVLQYNRILFTTLRIEERCRLFRLSAPYPMHITNLSDIVCMFLGFTSKQPNWQSASFQDIWKDKMQGLIEKSSWSMPALKDSNFWELPWWATDL